MVEVIETVPPVCPDPSTHARQPLWRWCVDALTASAFLVFAGLLAWALFGVRMHRIILAHGDFGSYGTVELPEHLQHNTKVLEFSAVRVPSRILHVLSWVRWPVPEVMEVTVRYQGPDGVARSWEKTYLLACDDKGVCEPLNALRGVILYGCCGPKGDLVDRGWVYFRDARPPQEYAVPGAPAPYVLPPSQPPEPQDMLPPKSPAQLMPGVTIA